MEQESLKPSKSRKKSYEGEGDMSASLKYPVDALSTIVYKLEQHAVINSIMFGCPI